MPRAGIAAIGVIGGMVLALVASPAAFGLASSGPPADCAGLISTAQNLDIGGKALLTATLAGVQPAAKGGALTYLFDIQSARQASGQPPGGPTYNRMEDCGYAGGPANNVKYATETLKPAFVNGHVIASLTVAATDAVCHRVTVLGTDAAGTPFQDFTNQLGVGAGGALPGACVPPLFLAGAYTPGIAAAAPSITSGSGPPADCATVLSTPQSVDNTGSPLITKTFSTAVKNGSTITYFFTIHSTRQAANQPPGGPTYTNIEDCAYIAGNPANIKYGTQSVNPPFQGGDVTVTITADAVDTICDRVVVDGTTNPGGVAFSDYTNLVGSGPTGPGGNGGPDPSACAPPQIPEASRSWQLPLVGAAMLIGVEAVRRRWHHLVA